MTAERRRIKVFQERDPELVNTYKTVSPENNTYNLYEKNLADCT